LRRSLPSLLLRRERQVLCHICAAIRWLVRASGLRDVLNGRYARRGILAVTTMALVTASARNVP
jgi:hypothetical protein